MMGGEGEGIQCIEFEVGMHLDVYHAENVMMRRKPFLFFD